MQPDDSVQEGDRDEELRLIAYTGPQAPAYLDLWSMRADLLFVIEACDRLESYRAASDESDPIVWKALWHAAVVSYGRAFTSGKSHGGGRTPRLKATALINRLDPEMRALHDVIFGERNQHIAHRVDGREAMKAIVVLAPPADQPAAVDLFIHGAHVAGGGRAGALRALVQRLVDEMNTIGTAAKRSILDEVNENDLAGAYTVARPASDGVLINVEFVDDTTPHQRT